MRHITSVRVDYDDGSSESWGGSGMMNSVTDELNRNNIQVSLYANNPEQDGVAIDLVGPDLVADEDGVFPTEKSNES